MFQVHLTVVHGYMKLLRVVTSITAVAVLRNSMIASLAHMLSYWLGTYTTHAELRVSHFKLSFVLPEFAIKHAQPRLC